MTDTKIIFILLLLSFSAYGQDVSPLKTNQPEIKNLFDWDNLIIVEKDWTEKDKYYVCDYAKGKLKRLTIDNDTAILGLAESKSFLFYITKKDDSYFLLTKNKHQDKWKAESLFSEFEKLQRFKLVTSDNFIVLVTPDKIYSKVLHSKMWEEVVIDSLFDHEIPMLNSKMPDHCLMTINSLYLGFDKGEWGGELWEIPFSTKSETPFSKGNLILDENIKGLQFSYQGVLWIATGLAHISLRESGIYKYQNAKLQQVLWSKPNLSLKEESDLSAFCLKNAEVPFFVASKIGVFKISNENLDEVLNAKLNITYNMKDYTVSSRPVAMHIDKDNTIFLAQRSLGVFVYKKTIGHYKLQQITFD